MFIYVGIYDVYANNGGDIFISRTKYRIIAMIPVKKNEETERVKSTKWRILFLWHFPRELIIYEWY